MTTTTTPTYEELAEAVRTAAGWIEGISGSDAFAHIRHASGSPAGELDSIVGRLDGPKHIGAEITDYDVTAKFNAVPWFEQASDEEIYAVYRAGWENDACTDAVAELCAAHEQTVTDFYTYLRLRYEATSKEAVGSDVSIDEGDALGWLKAFRCDVWNRIMAWDATDERVCD